MRRARCLLVAVVAGLFTAPGFAADWPTYQQSNSRLGASAAKLNTPLHLQWTYIAPAAPQTAWEAPRVAPIEGKLMRSRVNFDDAFQVAVVEGRVFFGSSVDHNVYCFDANTGQTYWTFPTNGPVRLSPTIWQGKAYFGSDDGFIYCVQAGNGKLVWKMRVGPEEDRLLARGQMISRWPVRTGVLIDDGVAYFGAGVFPHERVYLCAVDAASGKLIWRNDHLSEQDAGRNDLTPQGYLLCNDELLFVPSGRSMPAAFDRKTGEQVYKRTYSWRSTAGGVVGGTKALLADGQLYSGGAHHFLALDQKTGSVGFAFISGHQLAISENMAFVTDGKRIAGLDRITHAKATVERQKRNLELYAVERNRSKLKPDEYREQVNVLAKKIGQLSKVGEKWSTETTCDEAVIVLQGLVIAGGVNEVSAFDSNDGRKVWSAKVEGKARGLAAADGYLIVSTDAGRVYSFASADQTPLAQQPKTLPLLSSTPYPQDELSGMYAQAAEEILRRSGQTQGFCLVYGAENGRLAYALAKRSALKIIGLEKDPAKVAAARQALTAAGVYGDRVTMLAYSGGETHLSNYFANLIVSDTLLLTGALPDAPHFMARHLKPCGGVVLWGAPEAAPGAGKLSSQMLQGQLSGLGLGDQTLASRADGHWAQLTRGKLPGAGSWSHQYGDVANTNNSFDYRIKGGLGVLWYGDPGPSKIINRHEASTAPLSTNGRMFIQGLDSVMAYDAYNGTFLWEFKNPGALRTGVFNNEETSNLAASDDDLFIAVDDTCTRLDAATGKVLAVYKTPKSRDDIPRAWGYVAYYDGLLIGTSTVRSELARSLRRRGRLVDSQTDAIFAFDLKTGKRIWTHRGANILHTTIAINNDRVFYIDSSITKEERAALLRQDKTALRKLAGAAAKKAEEDMKKVDVRLAVAIDARSGNKLWSKAVDVTDCSRVGIGGGALTLMAHDGHVLICGANANGHYWRQFLSGQFSRRRLLVLDAASGEKMWSKDADYRHRPIIVENEIIAEPWGFDLHTGKQKTKPHPITGKEEPWQFVRPGHHCGAITGAPNMLFFRSYFTGYYDLYSDGGTKHFAGQRMGCWVNAVSGNGLLMVPEASAGCVCLFSIASTVVMEPKTVSDSWGIYTAQGLVTPVKRLLLNLGAPGDRRSDLGEMWLGYPRPNSRAGLDLPYDIQAKIAPGGGYYARSSVTSGIASDTPWVYASGLRGLTKCTIPLLDGKGPAAAYRVKLHFAALNEADGKAAFTIKLQGQEVEKDFQIVKEAGGLHTVVVREYPIQVTKDLIIELIPNNNAKLPVLSAIEAVREE